MTGLIMQSLSKQKYDPGGVPVVFKDVFCCFVGKWSVRKLTQYLLDACLKQADSLLFFFFFCRGNAPKLNFGSSSTTQATGITGGFGFGSSAPTSTPSSQAAAPAGFVFGAAATTTTTTTTTTQSGTTGGFTFASGTTTQVGTTGFNIGAASTATLQAAPTGLTFGAAPAAAATTAATLGTTAQPAAPFSLGTQSSGECLGLKHELFLAEFVCTSGLMSLPLG